MSFRFAKSWRNQSPRVSGTWHGLLLPMRIILTTILFCLLLAGCPPQRGVYHTVKPGQTIYSLSRAYGVDEGYLARINHVEDPTLLQAGTRLYIPGAERVREVESAASKPVPAERSRKVAETSKRRPAKAAKPQSTPAQRPTAPPAAAAGTFSWPLKGDLFRNFSTNGKNPSKGIEIAVPGGTAVLSSAAGLVIYSGNGIRGYGNLIILRHDDSFYTVYGYNRKNLVESGSFVSKGERIALVGTPPGGGPSRLYFEIRHGKEPVDPIFYLP